MSCSSSYQAQRYSTPIVGAWGSHFNSVLPGCNEEPYCGGESKNSPSGLPKLTRPLAIYFQRFHGIQNQENRTKKGQCLSQLWLQKYQPIKKGHRKPRRERRKYSHSAQAPSQPRPPLRGQKTSQLQGHQKLEKEDLKPSMVDWSAGQTSIPVRIILADI